MLQMIRLGRFVCLPLLLAGRLLLSRPSTPGLVAALPSSASFLAAASAAGSAAMRAPPVAKKVRHEMEMFGDVRVDDYYWLRDDSRTNPEVLNYLKEENDYTDFVMSGTKTFEDQLYAEIKGRIKEDDISAPVRRGPYYYYRRTLKGKEYVQYCRRLIPNGGAPPSVNDTMPTGPDAPEHVILDENIKAQEHGYYEIDAFKVSPNNKLVAYAEDTKGNEIYTVYVIDAETGSPVGAPLKGITSYLEWAGDEALVYITMDEILRPDKVLDPSLPGRVWLLIFKRVLLQTETLRLLDLLFFLFPIHLSDSEDGWTWRWDKEDLLSSIKIQDVKLFKDHLVLYERENGLPKATIYRLPPIGEAIEHLGSGRTIDFIDPVYSIDPEESQFSSNILRFSYSSMRTPPSVYDYDMDAGISVLKKIEIVLGSFDSSNYVTERKWATASDGTYIPISIVYQKNLVKLDGSDPLLLYGYGSYEVIIDFAITLGTICFYMHVND
ncbi:hypothetical protein Taro_004546 [Colocasia esculenta]|uniref:Peptidase S9A N-terminal domain-containing protein n=1 Tax=Colocasia esculenta TaxID=4460 RepID=A0A843TQC4_COLES|nr:hypothetical protein [Colocasia esculenta]